MKRPYKGIHPLVQVLIAIMLTMPWMVASAQVPDKLNYQGYLTDTGGTPITGSRSMVFTLYNTGGTSIYIETQTVSVANGIFNVAIGSVTPMNLPFDVPYFLGVRIGTDAEMTPRQAVQSSAYAQRADTANLLAPTAAVGGGQITGSITLATVPVTQLSGTIGAAQIANNSVTQAKLSPVSGAAAGSVLGTDGTDLRWQTTGGSGTVTSLTSGTGITLSPSPITANGSIAVDTATIQSRVTGTCAVGNFITAIGANGTVTCQPDNTGPANVYVQNGNAFGLSAVIGTQDNYAVDIIAGDNRVMHFEPNVMSPNVVGGHGSNDASIGTGGAMIGGGGYAGTSINLPETGTLNCVNPPSTTCLNKVTDMFGTVAGGIGNMAGNASGTPTDRPFATVGGGFNNISIERAATVSGGSRNRATGDSSTVGGGKTNMAFGPSSTVAGGENNIAFGQRSVIAGGANNSTSDTASIGSTIGGGISNDAGGSNATIAGGTNNISSATSSTVVGGAFNEASGDGSTVLGGYYNQAIGSGSIAAGGLGGTGGQFPNIAEGIESFAAGHGAHATSDGELVWADRSYYYFDPSTGPGGWGSAAAAANTFNVRAAGGVWFATSPSFNGGGATGVYLNPGSGAWASVSDRASKANFRHEDAQATLGKIAAMQIESWNYIAEGKAVRHLGPVSQDFYDAFRLGPNSTTVTSIDESGVAFLAIQGLNQKLEAALEEKNAQITAQAAQIEAQHSRLAALETQVTEIADLRQQVADLARLQQQSAHYAHFAGASKSSQLTDFR